jgi:hypothetical protein
MKKIVFITFVLGVLMSSCSKSSDISSSTNYAVKFEIISTASIEPGTIIVNRDQFNAQQINISPSSTSWNTVVNLPSGTLAQFEIPALTINGLNQSFVAKIYINNVLKTTAPSINQNLTMSNQTISSAALQWIVGR